MTTTTTTTTSASSTQVLPKIQRPIAPSTPITRRSKSPSFSTLALLFRHGVIGVGTKLLYKQHSAIVTKDVWLDSENEKFPSVHQWLVGVEPNAVSNEGDWYRLVQIEADVLSGSKLTLADHSDAILNKKLRATMARPATTVIPSTPPPPESPLPTTIAADSPDWQKRALPSNGSAARKRQRRRSPSPSPVATLDSPMAAAATSSTAATNAAVAVATSATTNNWHTSRVKQRTLEEMLGRPLLMPQVAVKDEAAQEAPTPSRAPASKPALYSAKKRAKEDEQENAAAAAPKRTNSASAMPPPPPLSAKKKKKATKKEKSRASRSPSPLPAAAAAALADASSNDGSDPVVILGSNLSAVQLLELQQVADRLGFKVVNEWSARVSHLVMPRCNSDQVVVRRTIKYLYALMSGIWVLEWAWVEACLKSDRHEAEAAFEVRGDEHMCESDAPRLMRKRTLSERHLFSEFVVYVHTKLSPDEGAPPREAIVELVQMCGAKLINEPPSVSDVRRWTNKQRTQRYTSVLIVCDDASLGARGVASLFNRAGSNLGLAPVIRYTWVIDCVSAAQQLRLAPYFCMPSAPVAQHSIAF